MNMHIAAPIDPFANAGAAAWHSQLQQQQHQPEDPPTPKPNFVDEKSKTWAFPAETPVADMTAEQKAEYWRYHAKKHEKNRKPDDFDQIAADAAAFRAKPPAAPAEGDTAAAAAAAKTEGIAEGRAAALKDTLPVVLETAIRSKNPDIDDDDLESIIDDLDLNKFITQTGGLDAARVQKLADKHAVKANPSTTPGAPGDPLAQALGHHQQQPGGSSTAGGSVASLREQARERIQPSKKS